MYSKKYFYSHQNPTLPSLLKELRTSKGLTQEEVAKTLYISRACWGNYETGHRTPSMEILKRIADFFEVDVNYLLGIESTNREISEFLYRKMQTSKSVTKDGFLDISDLPAIDKIEIIDFCEYLKARRISIEKQKTTA